MGSSRSLLTVPIAGIVLLACGSPTSSTESPWEYIYQVPEETGDGWQTGSLHDAGLDSVPILDLMSDLHETPAHQIHSIQERESA